MKLLMPIIVKSQLSLATVYLSLGMVVFGLLLAFFDTKYFFISVVFGGGGLISL